MDTQNFSNFDAGGHLKFTNPSIIEKDLRTLLGILEGIQSDSVITSKEHTELIAWINSAKEYETKQPYKEIIGLLREAISDDILTNEECKNISWLCNQYIKKTGYYKAITCSIQKLLGIVQGIVIDNEINVQELQYLDKWMEENECLKNTWPYDELYNLCTNILQDKIITSEEHEAFIKFAEAIVDKPDSNGEEMLRSLKTGFYQIDPSIEIQEKVFCITGLSRKYKRREIAEKIELYGGYVQDKVSSKINYLVVCDEKNTCWAFTCYGRKIEEAMKHRKSGASLVIVHEFDLYDHLESL